jgi:hypothetical protein
MNKLTLALIVALSSGYASASNITTWGGDLDGHFEPISIGSSDTAVSPVDIEAAYKGLDGDIDEHAFTTGMSSSVQIEMDDTGKPYADLDGNSDLSGDV